MRVTLSAAGFFLFVLVLSQGFEPRRADAWCCGCSCMYYCTCSGYYDAQQRGYCWYCRSSEPILQTKATDEGKEQLQLVNESSKAQSDLINRVTELRALGPCLRNKIALSLLGDYGAAMKFESMRFDENAKRETVAFQMDRQ